MGVEGTRWDSTKKKVECVRRLSYGDDNTMIVKANVLAREWKDFPRITHTATIWTTKRTPMKKRTCFRLL
jgi:hypothetical protein